MIQSLLKRRKVPAELVSDIFRNVQNENLSDKLGHDRALN